jgi:LAO/AO transport system kinase
MEELVKDKMLYPSFASGETLGGVARKLETITLCEAAGFDTIIIETVGVGKVKPPFTAWLIFPFIKISGAGDGARNKARNHGNGRALLSLIKRMVTILKENLAKLNLIERYICSLPKNQVGHQLLLLAVQLLMKVVPCGKLFKILGTDESNYFFETKNKTNIGC